MHLPGFVLVVNVHVRTSLNRNNCSLYNLILRHPPHKNLFGILSVKSGAF